MVSVEDTIASYDWPSAPSFANWAAVNEDGSCTWFASAPAPDMFRGRWAVPYVNSRSWPMYSTSRLFVGWVDSCRHRPGFNPDAPATPVIVDPPCVDCPGDGDVIITDVIGYIEAGLGNILVVPQCCTAA